MEYLGRLPTFEHHAWELHKRLCKRHSPWWNSTADKRACKHLLDNIHSAAIALCSHVEIVWNYYYASNNVLCKKCHWRFLHWARVHPWRFVKNRVPAYVHLKRSIGENPQHPKARPGRLAWQLWRVRVEKCLWEHDSAALVSAVSESWKRNETMTSPKSTIYLHCFMT